MPRPQRFLATVSRTTVRSAEAVYDAPAGQRDGIEGFSGAEITLFYSDQTDDHMPFDVGDTIEIQVKPTGRHDPREVEQAPRNIVAGRHCEAVSV